MPDTAQSVTPDFPESAPQRLRERVDALISGGAHTPEVLLQAAARAIDGVLGARAGDRGAALDVLSADALVTHALELLASHPDDFEARCDQIVQQLAALAPRS